MAGQGGNGPERGGVYLADIFGENTRRQAVLCGVGALEDSFDVPVDGRRCGEKSAAAGKRGPLLASR